MTLRYRLYDHSFVPPTGETAALLHRLIDQYTQGQHTGGDEVLALLYEALRTAEGHLPAEYLVTTGGAAQQLTLTFLQQLAPRAALTLPLWAELGTRYGSNPLPIAGVPVANATLGLWLSLLANDVAGGEVITPSLNYPGGANVICLAGATPRFVEIRPDSWQLDPVAVAAAINDRTRAILLVHMDQFHDLTPYAQAMKDRGVDLPIIQDASLAVGSTCGGAPVGLFNLGTGGTTVFSFATPKTLSGMGGGLVVTNRQATADRLHWLAQHGMELVPRLTITAVGTNARIHDLSAAMALAQLRRAESIYGQRRALQAGYVERLRPLAEAGRLTLQPVDAAAVPSHFMIRVYDRGTVARRLEEAFGIQTGFWPAHHLEPAYVDRGGLSRGALPITEQVADELLFLPFSGRLTSDDVDTIVDSLTQVLAS